MKEGIIICLVGESGSGKSTIANYLEGKGYKNINTYTTRLRRYDGEKGHVFVDQEEAKIIKSTSFECMRDQSLAYKSLFSNEWYWSYKAQYKQYAKCIYAFNPNGCEDLIKNVSDRQIITVYLNCSENERRNRMYKRINRDDEDYAEDKVQYNIEQRIENERDEYSLLKCDYVVNTECELKETLKKIDLLIDAIETEYKNSKCEEIL